MGKKNMISIILTIAAYVVVMIAVIGITAAMAEKITIQLVLSWGFMLIPYTALAGMQIMGQLDSRKHVMQNGMLITMAGIYLILTVVATIILNLLKIGIKGFVITEIIILVIGILLMIAGFMAKIHIEN